jgi:GxxExxY protein
MAELLYADLSYEIRGALYDVYNALGPGFREETYKIAVLRELDLRGVLVERELPIEITYKGVPIDRYRLDIVVDQKVILELKAAETLHPRHEAQLLSYLRAAGLRLGMLVNFGSNTLQIVRKIR